jgi:hypothetical protein
VTSGQAASAQEVQIISTQINLFKKRGNARGFVEPKAKVMLGPD